MEAEAEVEAAGLVEMLDVEEVRLNGGTLLLVLAVDVGLLLLCLPEGEQHKAGDTMHSSIRMIQRWRQSKMCRMV